MTEPDARHPMRRTRLLALALGVALVVAAGIWLGTSGDTWVAERWEEWTTALRAKADEVPEARLEEQRRLAGSESLLIVVCDDDGRGTSFAILSRAEDAEATLALLPSDLFDTIPGFGDFALAETTVFEGPELAALAVTNLLGIRIDGVLHLQPGELASALGVPIEVSLATPLIVEDVGGQQQLLAGQGIESRSPEAVEALLTEQGMSDSLEWLQRQADVWESLLHYARDDATFVDRLSRTSSDPELVAGIVARTAEVDGPQITVIPVERVVVAGATPAFKLATEEANEFVDRRMGHLVLWDGDRPRVEVLNGNGRIGTTRVVAESLIRRGFRVVKTDNAENFDFEQTLVIAQGREHRDTGAKAIGFMGTGELLLETQAPSGVVDLSIIVGHDIPAGEG